MMALRKGMTGRDGVARIPGAEGGLGIPSGLPLRFDQMKRILSAHKEPSLRQRISLGKGRNLTVLLRRNCYGGQAKNTKKEKMRARLIPAREYARPTIRNGAI